MTDQPGDLNCAQLMERLFLFLDNEMDGADCAAVRRHLEACAPCLAKYHLDCTVKDLVARSCCEQAPVTLRERVRWSIREQPDIGGVEPPAMGSGGPSLPWGTP